jgi:predicted lysophospholipase L1 biosynthesis ABC-type transport system permease subunit
LAGLTRSSKPETNWRAWASVLSGLVAAAALPAAVSVAEFSDLIRLIEAAGAIPLAGVLGIVAIMLARRARRRVERTLWRVGGGRIARVGQALGVLALCLALSGAIAVGFYYALTRLAE